MKFCLICKRLIPKGQDSCPFCRGDISSSKDKRRGFVRVPLKEIISFQSFSLDPQGENLSLKGTSQDISISGIYFEIVPSSISSLPYLKVSNIIWMEFTLPGCKKPLKLQGEIRRVQRKGLDKVGLGVMFINLDRKSYKILDSFILTYLRDKEEI
ncbi:MAG TPA: PilZ domain-containing protein [Candidatus Omnitrophica bacterium]|nr:MAG: hypothetical protein DRP61_02660 [Candidatus Omnitrophota bacterium]RKY33413.1 MAG: hypothetical protein DRP69_06355 [Candidatus Omnitrophota bacterium]RKY44142.1 MAG: hypothetical protein DRP80_03100 [Candidatus Omnitrophota bacterium]HEC69449.1 PilZ domain-containing protein [Candidatus Omnitrophota bacterium]